LGDLYRQIGAGFDRSAERYDLEAEANAAMAHMRRVSLVVLRDSFGAGQHVLELGCGTGEEAVALARDGIRVLATDVSSRMLDVARGKVSAAGLEQAVQTRQLAAGELSVLLDELGREAFDGAYSSFGALNGEPDLSAVGSALAELVRPGGRLVVSVMNRFYPFETLWYLAHGHPRQAVRRSPVSGSGSPRIVSRTRLIALALNSSTPTFLILLRIRDRQWSQRNFT